MYFVCRLAVYACGKSFFLGEGMMRDDLGCRSATPVYFRVQACAFQLTVMFVDILFV